MPLPAAALCLAAFALRVLPITTESLWRDEVDAIRFALAPSADLVANFARPGFNGPLYHLALGAWLRLGGVSDFTLRYASALCGVLAVALVYALARRLSGRRAGAAAAALMAASPVMVWYSGEGKMYAALVALVLVALLALWELSARRGTAAVWLVFVAAMWCGYGSHFMFALFLPVALLCWAAWRSERPRAAPRWLAPSALVAAALPMAAVAVWAAPAWWTGMDTGHASYALGEAAFTLAYNWTVGLSGRLILAQDWRWALPGMAAAAGLAALGAARGGRRTLPLIGWLIMPAGIALALSSRAALFEPRYVLWSAPALLILVGVGATALFEAGRVYAAGPAAAVALGCAVGIASQWAFPLRPDLRGAASALADGARPGDAIVLQIPYLRYGLEYYWSGRGPAATLVDGPFTNAGMRPDEAARALAAATALSDRIWLVESESALWDLRGLTRDWYALGGRSLEEIRLPGVTVSLAENPAKNRVFLPVMDASEAR